MLLLNGEMPSSWYAELYRIFYPKVITMNSLNRAKINRWSTITIKWLNSSNEWTFFTILCINTFCSCQICEYYHWTIQIQIFKVFPLDCDFCVNSIQVNQIIAAFLCWLQQITFCYWRCDLLFLHVIWKCIEYKYITFSMFASLI